MFEIFKPLYAIIIIFISLVFVVLDISADRGWYCDERIWCHPGLCEYPMKTICGPNNLCMCL